MPLIKISNVGQLGFIPDINPYDVAPNAWGVADRVAFNYGVAKSYLGFTMTSAVGSVSVTPNFIVTNKDIRGTDYLVYAGQTKIYGFFNSGHNNLTRTAAGLDVDYSASSFNAWQHAFINGILILNNGTDQPQQWATATATPRMANLTGWTSVWKANSIRTFSNFLVAVNVTKSGVVFPQMVKWSTSASLGAVPISWDELSLTNDSGEVELADTPDVCIDSLSLKDIHIIYKEKSTWGMRFVGFPDIFQFYKIFDQVGIMSKNCVGELNGYHYVLTENDIIRHDGNSYSSIVDQRIKEYIFSQLDFDNKRNCFLHIQSLDKLVIVGVPFSSTFVNRLFIYDTRFDTWAQYSISPIYSISDPGNIQTGAVWDTDAGTWDTDSSVWNEGSGLSKFLLAGSTLSNILFNVFSGQNANEADFVVEINREGFSFLDNGFAQQDQILKRINYIKPEISAGAGTQITISIGTKINYDDLFDWQTSRLFTVGQTKQLWFFATGRYFGVRFQSQNQQEWELKSYTLDVEAVGTYL